MIVQRLSFITGEQIHWNQFVKTPLPHVLPWLSNWSQSPFVLLACQAELMSCSSQEIESLQRNCF